MSRLIDADELLKHKTDHEYISTHLIYNAPTVDSIPTQAVRDAIAEIEEEKIDIDIDIGEEIIYNRAIDDCINIIHKHTGIGEE